MLPLVSVIITTYNRTQIARRTITGLTINLKYPNLQWIIADDGSDEGHIKALMPVFPLSDTKIVTQASRGGVGKSKNLALNRAFEDSPYVLLLEDDWLLEDSFDLESHVQVMENHSDVGMVRFGYLGAMPDENFTAVYRDYGNFRAYWDLQPASAMYIYSGQVSLRHKRWYDSLGYHAEGVQAGQEEEDMCRRYNARYAGNELIRMVDTTANMAHLLNATADVVNSLRTSQNIVRAHYNSQDQLKILWPAEYGCILNSGPFKNIGLGESTNAVQP